MKKILGILAILLGCMLALGVAMVLWEQGFHFSQDMAYNIGSIVGYLLGLSLWAMAIIHLFKWGVKKLKE